MNWMHSALHPRLLSVLPTGAFRDCVGRGLLNPRSRKRDLGHPFGSDSFGSDFCERSCLLQVVDFGQELGGLVFKLCALHIEVFFRILAGAELEVEVAEVFVELVLALQQVSRAEFSGAGWRRRSPARRCRPGRRTGERVRRSILGFLSWLKSLRQYRFPGEFCLFVRGRLGRRRECCGRRLGPARRPSRPSGG